MALSQGVPTHQLCCMTKLPRRKEPHIQLRWPKKWDKPKLRSIKDRVSAYVAYLVKHKNPENQLIRQVKEALEKHAPCGYPHPTVLIGRTVLWWVYAIAHLLSRVWTLGAAAAPLLCAPPAPCCCRPPSSSATRARRGRAKPVHKGQSRNCRRQGVGGRPVGPIDPRQVKQRVLAFASS